MNTKKLIAGILCGAALFAMTACGKDTSELDTYKASCEVFFKNIAYLGEQIDTLDGTNEEDVDKLLGYLDQMKDQFSEFADLSVPGNFANVEDLADEAKTNMDKANEYYHEAYKYDGFSQNYADAAFEYYSRANLRINYILKILHGEEITDENVVYTNVDDDDSPEQDNNNSEE